MRYLPLTFSLSLLLLMGGCAGTGQQPGIAGATEAAPPAAAASESETVAEPVAEPPERPFPDDSLYSILVAEFALRRRQYDVALDTYMAESFKLKDAGVSAHTTRLAQFMRRDADAIAAGELWVELEPENLEARLSLANLLARNGRPQESLVQMEAIIRAGGQANFTSLARGYESLPPEAQLDLLQRIRGLSAEFPDNSQLRLAQVLMLEALGQPETALEQLQPVFETQPHQPQAIVLDAKLRLDVGQREGAFDRVNAALEADPDNSRLRLQYARLLTQTDMAEAERQFRMLLDAAPEDPDLLFSMALIQREMRDLESARENLERLLQLNARTDEAHYYLGKTAEEQGRIEDAVIHYMQVQPGRDFGSAAERLARILLDRGQSAELGAYFDHLRFRNPELAEQLFAVEADKLMASRHLAEASALLDRALQEFSESVSLRYSRSILSERLGNVPAAEADLRHILQEHPDNATALNALGYMLANRTDRYEESETLITRALELSPNEPAILDSMGWVKYRLGDYETALAYLQRAYRAFPDPEVAAHLGEVLWVMGRDSAAVAIWSRALGDSPDHTILLETIQRFGVDLADRQ
jgi:tetratricopeptide (TPR) repeat protein